MLTQIDVMSDDLIELPILGVTPKSSLLLQKVTGLNPPDRTLFIGDYSQDGGLYQGRRVGNRNVVFTINLNPNPALGETVSGLRESLYKAFIDPQVDGDYLKLVLRDENDNETYLVGYCEKFETEVFDSDSMCQISMICPDPYLRANQDTFVTHPSGLVEFPFSYQGSAETGFVVRIYVSSPTSEITLLHNGKVMKLNGGPGYEVGDIIIINTIRGQRSITLTKASDLLSEPTEFVPPNSYNLGAYVFYGPSVWIAVDDTVSGGTTYDMAPDNNNDYWDEVSTSILAHLDSTSRWLELHASSNIMRVHGITTDDVVASIRYLKYTSAYWGI